MEYFNQDEYMKEIRDYEEGRTKKRPNPDHRCQFCKDIGIKFYYPEFLKVEVLDHLENPFEMVKRMINNQFVPDWVIELYIKEEHVSASNCIVCYIPNGFKDKKKNQNIYIKKKSYGDSDVPKKHIEELEDYNGIKYLEWFKAEG